MEDNFYELTPDQEVERLTDENKSLTKEISRISFASVRQTAVSLTKIPNQKARSTLLTKPSSKTSNSDLEVDLSETSFRPLPFHRTDARSAVPKFNGTADSKVQLKEYSVDLSNYAIKAPADDSKDDNDELLQSLITSQSLKKTGHFESIEMRPQIVEDSTSFKSIGYNKPIITREVCKRLIGEIAFQLDRRILKKVFSHRKRLYGFTVRNIQEKIDEYCSDYSKGTLDAIKQATLTKKKKYVMQILKKNCGYNEAYHPIFSEMIVNKFGVLKIPEKTNYGMYKDKEFLRSIILKTIENESDYTYDTMVLLNGLVYLSELDNKPIFMW